MPRAGRACRGMGSNPDACALMSAKQVIAAEHCVRRGGSAPAFAPVRALMVMVLAIPSIAVVLSSHLGLHVLRGISASQWRAAWRDGALDDFADPDRVRGELALDRLAGRSVAGTGPSSGPGGWRREPVDGQQDADPDQRQGLRARHTARMAGTASANSTDKVSAARHALPVAGPAARQRQTPDGRRGR